MEPEEPRELNVIVEIWRGFRPYFVNIAIDLLVSASLWAVLFVFKSLTKWLSVESWAATFIVNVHAAGAVAAFILFALMFVSDLFRIHKQKA